MQFEGEHILSTKQFDREGLLGIFEYAKKMEKMFKKGPLDILQGKILATLFFEPSTRTRFSFETAMIRLGGSVISNFDMLNTSSLKKMESLSDTGKVVSQMADVIAMRHGEIGSVGRLADGSDVPVINAGDGAGEHPTQALLDLYTIWKEKGSIDNLTIGIIGDLKYGRVAHSQADLLKHFFMKFILVSPEGLRMPDYIVEELKNGKHEVIESDDLEEFIGEMDVIAMTRIQKERFDNEADYDRYAGSYVLNNHLMSRAKIDSIVIHPLPRVDEIDVEIDRDPRAKYFDQVKNGIYVRMALICKVLGIKV